MKIVARQPKNNNLVLWRKALGIALLTIRERRGFQQQNVARQVSTTRSHLSRMEKGGGDPRLSMMIRISTVLRISPIVLMREIVKAYQTLKQQS